MEHCLSCGHELGIGRFCVNCGHPVGAPLPTADPVDAADPADAGDAGDAGDPVWRTDTAERPPAPEPVPPPVTPPPTGGARYPLFADELAAAMTTQAFSPVPAEPTHHHHQHRARRGWVPWLVGGAALLLLAGLGGWLLSGDDEPAAAPTTPIRSTPSRIPNPSPTASATPAPGKPQDVARLATVTVPATAPPNQDLTGNMVRYEGRNMLDGVPATCWRMPGDGTGAEITLDLAGPTTLTRIGLVNGYAKDAVDAQGRTLDWYHGNRRVLSAEWVFDDGTTVTQSFDDTRSLQTVDIDPVTTGSVVLRLVTVSEPGEGPARRDYTALSDVSLVGTEA